MFIGYARVSTDDQGLALQRTALKQAGCRRIYEEKVSGARREQDVVVVYRLNRLVRSTRDLLEIAEQLREVGAERRRTYLSFDCAERKSTDDPALG